jgi:anti-sigma factor RsiW
MTTFCDEVLELVEPIAAHDLEVDDRLAAHLATCAGCAAALEGARRIDRLLRERPVPEPPPQFTSRVLTRIRRERWRREQVFDLGFNVALGVLLLGVSLAVWLFADVIGLRAIGGELTTGARVEIEALAERIAPALPLYAGAVALIASAIGLWWWAERDAAL